MRGDTVGTGGVGVGAQARVQKHAVRVVFFLASDLLTPPKTPPVWTDFQYTGAPFFFFFYCFSTATIQPQSFLIR